MQYFLISILPIYMMYSSEFKRGLLSQMIYILGKVPYPNTHWPLPIIGNLHTFVDSSCSYGDSKSIFSPRKNLYIQAARPSDRQPSEYKFHFGSINLLCPYNYGLRKSTKKYLPCSLFRGGGGTGSTHGPYILPGKKQNLY